MMSIWVKLGIDNDLQRKAKINLQNADCSVD